MTLYLSHRLYTAVFAGALASVPLAARRPEVCKKRPSPSEWLSRLQFLKNQGSTIRTLFTGALFAAGIFGPAAYAQTFTLGETTLLGYSDNGNANLLLAQGPYHLNQPATVQSLSFYVTTAAGQLRLGMYTAGPNNDCKGGSLRAQTNAFAPRQNSWNSANVTNQMTLPVGNYCLAYNPSSNNLSFRKGLSTGNANVYYPYAFGPLPQTFSSSPGGDPFHWSFYATLMPSAPPPTLSVSFSPPNPSVPSNAAAGTVVAQVIATWSNGNPFTGILDFTTPYGSDGNTFAMSGSNLIVNSSGPGLSAAGNTVQNVTVIANQ
jgi:hypothetical protein